MSATAYSARAPLTLALGALAILVLGLGSWAMFTRIAGAVIAEGVIEVERNLQVVQHPEGGVVEEVLITEGQSVTAGQPLLRLDGAQLRSELRVIEARLFESLAQRARFEAERDGADEPRFAPLLHEATRQSYLRDEVAAQMAGQATLLQARRATMAGLLAQLAQRQAMIDRQLAGITTQIAAVEQQRTLVAQERGTQAELLARGLAQAARLLALDRESARLDGSLGALVAERAMAAERRAEIGHQILSLTAQQKEEAQRELHRIAAQIAELTERRRALSDQIARLDLRAPVSGIVHGLAITTPQAVLRAAEPALYIVPKDRPLVVVARLNPSDIDQVTQGQQAAFVISGLNLHDLPQLSAEVIHISADAFTDSARARRYYQVDLAMHADSLAALGPRGLLPGMPVEVFFQTGRRSPMAYLTQPLTAYFSRALREG